MMHKQLIRTFSASLLAGGMALSGPALAAEGLYSADNLMDAEIFDSAGEEVGEVEDILMGDDMSVHSLIMETDGVLGMGGRELVLERGQFTVQTRSAQESWDEVEYEVHVEATQEEIKQFQEYDEGWWNRTREGAAQAWDNTKEGASNAWESTKEATSSAWESTKDATENLTDDAEEAADDM